MVHCSDVVSLWFHQNALLLNPDKTEAVLFVTRQRLVSVDFSHTIKVAGADIQFSEAVKLLGVMLNTSLSFDQHVTNVVRACNFHLRSLRYLRPLLTFELAKSMATAIISARIDYCNSLLYGTTEHRAPDERHGSAPTAALVTDQTTDHVQASDPYFQGEVLSDPTVSSRTASRPPGCQGTSIYYRSTVLPTICVHRLRLSGFVLLLCTSSLELSQDIHKIGEHFQ